MRSRFDIAEMTAAALPGAGVAVCMRKTMMMIITGHPPERQRAS